MKIVAEYREWERGQFYTGLKTSKLILEAGYKFRTLMAWTHPWQRVRYIVRKNRWVMTRHDPHEQQRIMIPAYNLNESLNLFKQLYRDEKISTVESEGYGVNLYYNFVDLFIANQFDEMQEYLQRLIKHISKERREK